MNNQYEYGILKSLERGPGDVLYGTVIDKIKGETMATFKVSALARNPSLVPGCEVRLTVAPR